MNLNQTPCFRFHRKELSDMNQNKQNTIHKCRIIQEVVRNVLSIYQIAQILNNNKQVFVHFNQSFLFKLSNLDTVSADTYKRG